jgi:hypothetical protein
VPDAANAIPGSTGLLVNSTNVWSSLERKKSIPVARLMNSIKKGEHW